jgi:3-methylfumaryl-CoA hydratase
MNAWQAWIGRVTNATTVLDPEQANHLAVTLDRDPDLREGDDLPPAWHWLFFHDLVRASQLGEDGHPRLGITMPPVDLPRRMWSGGTLAFHVPLVLGSAVTRTSAIRSITPKQGRTGRLWFVTVAHEYRTGEILCLDEEQTIVYRELPSTLDTPPPPPAPRDAAFSAAWTLDPIALFRYSALTFNGHRIHYDADWCRGTEGYPGLVIHGPLIATLLLDLAAREGRALGRFTYRAKHPLFLPHVFTVNGRPDGARTRLWAADHEGGLAMDAEVEPGP